VPGRVTGERRATTRARRVPRTTTRGSPTTRRETPRRAPGLVLVSLILVAAVANLNLSVANVALPDIGRGFDAGQVSLNLIAVVAPRLVTPPRTRLTRGPREEPGGANFDYDRVLIGWGFGGSVAEVRAVEKG
jgi:hypothetical protein